MKAQRAPDQNPITDDIRVFHSARHPASGAEIDLSAVRLEERADLVGIGYASPNPVRRLDELLVFQSALHPRAIFSAMIERPAHGIGRAYPVAPT
jgi:hypothetical protein